MTLQCEPSSAFSCDTGTAFYSLTIQNVTLISDLNLFMEIYAILGLQHFLFPCAILMFLETPIYAGFVWFSVIVFLFS